MCTGNDFIETGEGSASHGGFVKNANVSGAVGAIKKGELIIVPTDTVYGIGCDPHNDEAVKRLFAVKKRPKNKSIPLLVDSFYVAESIGLFPKYCKVLLHKHWPGALTVIVRKKESCLISKYVSEKDTIALRMPNQKDLLHLIKEAGGVLAVTSANISGERPISNADGLQKAFSRDVSIIIDGGIQNGTPSTIINCVGDNPSIVRQGSVYIESSTSGD